MDLLPAHHKHIDGVGEFWAASLSGFYVQCLTTDPDLVLYARPYRNSREVGVELVDHDGRQYAFQCQRW